MARESYANSKPGRICEVEGREGTFLLIRKAKKNSRVVLFVNPDSSGEIVETGKILRERDIPKEEASVVSPTSEGEGTPQAQQPVQESTMEPTEAQPADATLV